MARSQTIRLGLAVGLTVVIIAFAVAAISVWAQVPAAPALPTWPAFTMTYETDGIVYSIGSSQAQTTREIRRLDYQSATEWTDIVIEAPTIPTSVASTSRVGSYMALSGNSLTESESAGEKYSSTVEEDTTYKLAPCRHHFPSKRQV